MRRPADPALADHDAAGCGLVDPDMRDVDALAAQHGQRADAHLVDADPAEPGHGMPEPREADRHGQLRPLDVETGGHVVPNSVG